MTRACIPWPEVQRVAMGIAFRLCPRWDAAVSPEDCVQWALLETVRRQPDQELWWDGDGLWGERRLVFAIVKQHMMHGLRAGRVIRRKGFVPRLLTLSLDQAMSGADADEPGAWQIDPGLPPDVVVEAAMQVRQVLNGLPTTAQRTVLLATMHGWGRVELAAWLGVPPSTVYTRLGHARRSAARFYRE